MNDFKDNKSWIRNFGNKTKDSSNSILLSLNKSKYSLRWKFLDKSLQITTKLQIAYYCRALGYLKRL